jgi:small-conductance mechanosensitive channel
MNTALTEMLGWLGYLQRPSVLLQLAGVIVMALMSQLIQRRWLTGVPLRLQAPLRLWLTPLLIALWAGLLGATGQLQGLVLFLLWWRCGWSVLVLLHPLLGRVLDPEQRYDLETRLLRPVFLVAGAIDLINQLDTVNDVAAIPVGQAFGVEISVGKVFVALAISYLVIVGSGLPAGLLSRGLQRLLGISESSRKAMELILRYAVAFVGILAVAMHIGINPTAVIAIAGGLSVGLGFGIKEIFSNFISGLWLLFEGSVRPGEVLMIDGDPCEVRRLGLRATVLWRDRDNAELLIPNQSFFTQDATTYTGSDRLRRSQVTITAGLQHDPAMVIQLLEQTAAGVPSVLPTPPPKALLISYGDWAVNYALRFWISNPMNNISSCSAVNQAIWTAFKAHGIEIPYPQQVAHVALEPGMPTAAAAAPSPQPRVNGEASGTSGFAAP